jgi:hypothetical protein
VVGIRWIIAALLLGISCGATPEQEPMAGAARRDDSRASAESKAAMTGAAAPSMAEYKIVFWFDGTTWRSQAYNLRKGEYTAAVDDWVNRIEFDAFGFARPGHMATVREISLPETPAESFKERLAAAIRDELERTLRGSAVPPRQSWAYPLPISHGSGPMDHVGPRARPARGPIPSPGASGVDPLTLPQPSPFPYPYARPHP